MTLPEIPDQAVAATAGVVRWASDGDLAAVHDGLTAAWPHLYAAALRHASGRLNDQDHFAYCTSLEADAVASELRDWAEEMDSTSTRGRGFGR